jgi:hypothetical protein
VRVKVKQSHIDEGQPGESCTCAVAKAVQAAFETENVQVEAEFIQVDFAKYPTPDAVVKFIDDYDLGRPVRPFEFDLGPDDDEDGPEPLLVPACAPGEGH